jgi:hypothetical protein
MYFVGCLEDNHALSFIIYIDPIWYSNTSNTDNILKGLKKFGVRVGISYQSLYVIPVHVG